MAQSQRLQQMDARFARAFSRSGLADAALYRRNGTVIDVPCTIYVDRSSQLQGDLAQVANDDVVVTAFVGDIGTQAPARGDTFSLGTLLNGVFTPSGEVFAIDGLTNKDESRFVCLVINQG